METLREALRRDRSKTKTFRVSELGLVEMTRQRVRPSLIHYFSSPCPCCNGTGKRLSLASLAMKVERLLRRVSSYCTERKIVVRVNPELAVYFLEGSAGRLESIEKRYKLSVEIEDDEDLGWEECRLFARGSGKELTDQVLF